MGTSSPTHSLTARRNTQDGLLIGREEIHVARQTDVVLENDGLVRESRGRGNEFLPKINWRENLATDAFET
jgi:hypothetical protein